MQDYAGFGTEFVPAQFLATPHWLHWASGQDGIHFGTAHQAMRNINSGAVPRNGTKRVNIVIVDEGFLGTYAASKGGRFEGGIASTTHPKRIPGFPDFAFKKARTSHAHMLIRPILDFAPRAHYYDMPIIPDRIDSLTKFAFHATFAF